MNKKYSPTYFIAILNFEKKNRTSFYQNVTPVLTVFYNIYIYIYIYIYIVIYNYNI